MFGIGSPDIYDVALAPESASLKIEVIARILHIDKLGHNDIHRDLKACLEHERKSKIIFLLTDAVYAGYGSYDDDIIPRKERLCSLVAHTVDLVID